jgi:predicted amidohydrolase
MSTFTIAAAQSFSVAGDLAANIARHLRFMAVAAEQGVELLVFPELSLTGYEGQMAADMAIDPQDSVLQPLRDCARELGLIAVVGMPIRHKDSSKVLIGALTLGGMVLSRFTANNICTVAKSFSMPQVLVVRPCA